MKNYKNFIYSLLIASVAIFSSCSNNDDDNNATPSSSDLKAYVVNYGSYSGAKSEIDIYNPKDSTITHKAYKAANDVEFASNIESMAISNGTAYFMSNNGDKIDIVNAGTLKATTNPISDSIVKPRYFTSDGATGYISCWGGDDWGVLANSYIAKIDLTSNTLVKKLPMAGGPEGVIVVNGKLYGALSTTNKIAVMDLSDESITYINTLGVPEHFVVDADGKLWVSMVSKYSTPIGADSLGLAQIDPNTNTVLANVKFSGIGSNGYIKISHDKKTIYVLGNEAWPGTGSSIYSVNTTTKQLSSSAIISGEHFNGLGINPENDNLYVLISPSTQENGKLDIFTTSGTLLKEVETGISPKHVVFYAE